MTCQAMVAIPLHTSDCFQAAFRLPTPNQHYGKSKDVVWVERISPAVTCTEAVAVLVFFDVAKVDIIPCRAKQNAITARPLGRFLQERRLVKIVIFV